MSLCLVLKENCFSDVEALPSYVILCAFHFLLVCSAIISLNTVPPGL
jgi:hypothetical protein